MVFFESFGCSFNFYEKLRLKNNFVFFSLRIEKIFYQQRVKCFISYYLLVSTDSKELIVIDSTAAKFNLSQFFSEQMTKFFLSNTSIIAFSHRFSDK